jgi:hypothetical protein
VSNQGSKMMTIHSSGKMKWEKETKVVQWHSTRHKKHEIVQKTPQQNFEGNQAFCQFQQNQKWHDKNDCGHNLMSVTLQSIRPSPSSWIAVMSCHDSLLSSSAPNSEHQK